jgi:integrase
MSGIFMANESDAVAMPASERQRPPGLSGATGTEDRKPFDGWSKRKPKFEKTCLLPHWTLHDLRRTFATNLAALGVPIQVTEKLLNHISGTAGGIVAVYQRPTYENEMRDAVEKWEVFLEILMREKTALASEANAELQVQKAA